MKLKDFNNLLFIVLEIGLCFKALILNSNFVVEPSCQLFGVQCSKILLLTVDHKEDLPRVSILGDPTVLGAAKVVHIATLVKLLVRTNDILVSALGTQNFNESSPLFLYLY